MRTIARISVPIKSELLEEVFMQVNRLQWGFMVAQALHGYFSTPAGRAFVRTNGLVLPGVEKQSKPQEREKRVKRHKQKPAEPAPEAAPAKSGLDFDQIFAGALPSAATNVAEAEPRVEIEVEDIETMI